MLKWHWWSMLQKLWVVFMNSCSLSIMTQCIFCEHYWVERPTAKVVNVFRYVYYLCPAERSMFASSFAVYWQFSHFEGGIFASAHLRHDWPIVVLWFNKPSSGCVIYMSIKDLCWFLWKLWAFHCEYLWIWWERNMCLSPSRQNVSQCHTEDVWINSAPPVCFCSVYCMSSWFAGGSVSKLIVIWVVFQRRLPCIFFDPSKWFKCARQCGLLLILVFGCCL